MHRPSRWIIALGLATALPAAAQSVDEFFRDSGAALREIGRLRESFWRSHVAASRARILEAADRVARPRVALALGAGSGVEIPLAELARRFSRVVLVDLDEPSLLAATAALDPEAAARVEIVKADVTSFASGWMRRAERIVASEDDFERAAERLAASIADVPERPPELPRADLLVSSLTLSELPRYPLNFADRLVREKFGRPLKAAPLFKSMGAAMERLARRDHARILARTLAPDGVLYYADTTARGPDFSRVADAERRRALESARREAERRGLFRAVAADSELADLHRRISASLLADRDGGDAGREAVAADALLRMFCGERFEDSDEAAVIEAFVEGLDRSFEALVDVEAFVAELAALGLRPLGEIERWRWLEYGCSATHRAGAFRVESRVFGRR